MLAVISVFDKKKLHNMPSGWINGMYVHLPMDDG